MLSAIAKLKNHAESLAYFSWRAHCCRSLAAAVVVAVLFENHVVLRRVVLRYLVPDTYQFEAIAATY